MNKIFITGGAGFIGSNFIHYCLDKNDIVLNFDLLTYAGNLNNFKSIKNKENYNFINGNICDKELLDSTLNDFKPAFIINFAAESHVDLSIDNPDSFINTNIVGTYKLLLSSLEYYYSLNNDKQKNFKFLHVSTDEVYGSINEGSFFTEESKYNPSSPYSASKAASDHLVNAWNKTYNFPTIITNSSNNYGPFQFPEKLIPHMIQKCLNEQNLPIYGNGKNIRDWIYVKDHCEAHYQLLINRCKGTKYNIGGGQEKTNLEVVEAICEILDKLMPSVNLKSYKELIEYVEDRPGHDFRYAIDYSKIKKEIGWEPKVNFKEGLFNTINWYLNNQNWIDMIINKKYSLKRVGLK